MNPKRQPAHLDAFGDVLTLTDFAALIKRSRRYCERLAAMERATGMRMLPDPIPGLKHRFTKDAVAKWLRKGFERPALRRSA